MMDEQLGTDHRLMPVRTINDEGRVQWHVYDVTLPSRMGRPNQPQINNDTGGFRVPESWLCFESANEKRRLSPIPEGWEGTSNEEMLRLLSLAIKVQRI
jgi:hypothetical protein